MSKREMTITASGCHDCPLRRDMVCPRSGKSVFDEVFDETFHANCPMKETKED